MLFYRPRMWQMASTSICTLLLSHILFDAINSLGNHVKSKSTWSCSHMSILIPRDKMNVVSWFSILRMKWRTFSCTLTPKSKGYLIFFFFQGYLKGQVHHSLVVNSASISQYSYCIHLYNTSIVLYVINNIWLVRCKTAIICICWCVSSCCWLFNRLVDRQCRCRRRRQRDFNSRRSQSQSE